MKLWGRRSGNAGNHAVSPMTHGQVGQQTGERGRALNPKQKNTEFSGPKPCAMCVRYGASEVNVSPPARRRYTRAIAARPGKARSQGSSGVKRRKSQRLRTAKRRAGTSS